MFVEAAGSSVVGGKVVSCFWKKVWIGQVGCEMNGEKGKQRGRYYLYKFFDATYSELESPKLPRQEFFVDKQ